MYRKIFFILFIFIFLIFLFNFGCTPQATEEIAPTDTVPPYITSISLTPSTSQVTGSFTVSVGAADDSSGVDWIYCVLESPTNQSQGGSIGQIITMYLAYNSTTKKWEKTEKLLPYDAEQGDWMLNNIIVVDKRKNHRKYERISEQSLTNYCDLKSTSSVVTLFPYAKINVTAPPADNDAPDMLSISVDEPDTSTTRDIVISIDATDDLSCVKSVSCKVESPDEQSVPGSGDVKEISFYYNISESLWQGNASFEYGAETGDWMINTIVVEDNAGNIRNYERRSESSITSYYDVNNSSVTSFLFVKINVFSSKDNLAPYMQDLYAYPPATTSNVRDITISIDTDEDFSGVSGIICVLESPTEQLLGGGTHELVNVTLTFSSSNEIWEGIASIPAGAEEGDWMINNITIEDNAGNTRIYDRRTEISPENYYDETDHSVSSFPFKFITVVN